MFEIAKSIIDLVNSIGAGVIANYIFKNIGKWLDSSSTDKK